jgi:transcriptional regulator with XRE-family HTH domain
MKPEIVTMQAILVDHVATGARMKEARKSAGIPQKDVAKTMVIKASYLSDLERGRRNWTPLLAMKFKDAIKNGRAK